ncbi:hypothetical protein SAMN04487910_3877 [Aquimarina amphilecti]|uniref:Uncharacterized protein n=1 Tax=Aquimarina amphilecti TaxID=1038014 RepID=A0A1H7UVB2_AQUAM|nr:hypothetical protein [Aquimarina amphilecti]SEM00397.1 hypothetical protein SAMN04487910_3877 [Aquimarina amphilecti]
MKKSILYQWTYILFATAISTLVLYQYAKELPELISNDNLTKEIAMCSGQLLWQGSIIMIFIKKKIHTYLYNMISVSLLGSLALIPLILVYKQEVIIPEIKILLFLFVVCLMILDHTRRVKKLKLPGYLTITWITYRLLWLPILLF